jgi:hypothetical protein
MMDFFEKLLADLKKLREEREGEKLPDEKMRGATQKR